MNKMEEVVVLLGREHRRVLPNNKKASDDGFALTNIQSISALIYSVVHPPSSCCMYDVV